MKQLNAVVLLLAGFGLIDAQSAQAQAHTRYPSWAPTPYRAYFTPTDSLLQQALSAFQAGDYPLVKATLGAIHPLDTLYVKGLWLGAQAAVQFGEPDDALGYLAQLDKHPNPYRLAAAGIRLDLLYQRYQTTKLAEELATWIKAYQAARLAFPLAVDLPLAHGTAMATLNQPEQSLEALLDARKLNPLDAGIHANLGDWALSFPPKDTLLATLAYLNALLLPLEDDPAVELRLRLDELAPAWPSDEAVSTEHPYTETAQLEALLTDLAATDTADFPALVRPYVASMRGLAADERTAIAIAAHLPIGGKRINNALEPYTEALENGLNRVHGYWMDTEGKVLLPGDSLARSTWFDDNGAPAAVGLSFGGQDYGYWVYYYPNHARRSEGAYDRFGNQTGEWQYYDSTGTRTWSEKYRYGAPTAAQYYHLNGQPAAQYAYQNDEIRGPFRRFHPNGQLAEKGVLGAQGRQLRERYFANGQLAELYQVFGDSATGLNLSYYPSGHQQVTLPYYSGQPHGEASFFHPNDTLAAQGEYLNGLKTGVWTHYSLTGNPVKEEHYETAGALTKRVIYYPEGAVQEVQNLIHGELCGPRIRYTPEGRNDLLELYTGNALQRAIGFSVNGEVAWTCTSPDGNFPYNAYWANQKPRHIGRVQAGYRHGPWVYYDTLGTKLEAGTYEMGAKQGEWTSYAGPPDGRYIRQRETYLNDTLHGFQAEFSSQGRVLALRRYVAGLQEGWAFRFSSTGEPLQSRWYQSDSLRYQADYLLPTPTPYRETWHTDTGRFWVFRSPHEALSCRVDTLRPERDEVGTYIVFLSGQRSPAYTIELTDSGWVHERWYTNPYPKGQKLARQRTTAMGQIVADTVYVTAPALLDLTALAHPSPVFTPEDVAGFCIGPDGAALQGTYRNVNESGLPAFDFRFKQGVPHGTWVAYDDGAHFPKPIRETLYWEGIVVSTRDLPNE